ncbi:DUF5309 domain-containing protein [Salibacterium qingdaonense]|uniref:Phage major capsid protein, HK97 family n=1 Tax=Salibacterium qingdaonense TaxID=266892 RepID=A0A1I4QMG4_9BACI|nr:DUF5309 domain-containing protein [Salibacterium qingdaonense]SFM41231.1 hypothetical protein SAMN04488054_14513 [Salibacterium qingdaonense]
MIKTTDMNDNEILDLSREIALVAPTQTPLTTMLAAESAHAPTVDWREKKLDSTSDIFQEEGAETTTFQQSSRPQMSNVCSIFKKAASVSGTLESTDVTGISNIFSEEINDRLTELKINMENQLFNSTYDDGSTDGIRKLRGLEEWVETDMTVTGAMNKDNFKNTIKKLWDAGNSGNYVAFVNADLKEQLDSFYSDQYYYQAKENEFGLVVNRVQTNYGMVDIHLSRHVNPEKIFVFDPQMMSVPYLRAPRFEQLAKNGDNRKGHVIAEGTLKLKSKDAIAALHVDTSA